MSRPPARADARPILPPSVDRTCRKICARANRLSWRDSDLHRSVRSEIVAIRRMMLGVPVPNASFCLTQKIEAALLGQVSEVANQVCDSMLVASATVVLEDRHRVGGPSYVSGFVAH